MVGKTSASVIFLRENRRLTAWRFIEEECNTKQHPTSELHMFFGFSENIIDPMGRPEREGHLEKTIQTWHIIWKLKKLNG